MKIAVYCGASAGLTPDFADAATEVGQWLAHRGDTLIYGGGKVGLMGVLAQSVLNHGGQVLGIMPQVLVERELAMPGIALEVVSDMAVRKQRMLTLADVNIALPGGPGTLEEITEAISWSRIGLNASPNILFNRNHFYDPLQQQYQQMVSAGFYTASDLQKILFSDDLAVIAHFIDDYTPPAVRQY